MKKILFTLLVFLIYKAATYITVPLINPEQISQFFDDANGGFIGIANAFTGNALRNYSIIALGIGPYITASIVVQILQMDIVPILKEWQEEGETGKKKLNQLTRYLAIGMAFVQALAMTYGFRLTGDAIFDLGVEPTFLTYTYLAIVMTAGTAFLLWLADQLVVERPSESKEHRAIHGTTRALINNMVVGVSEGFRKELKMIGVGYRAQLQGNKLVLSAGYSHPVEMEIPEGLTVEVPKNTLINISGIDKQLVGEFSANIRGVRPPEPYLGKGIRYVNEHVRRKEGKTAK
ncbi:MAG: 50S ribosomal protein L6 [Candidatus Izemoplasmataceae bacterium]